MRIDRLDLTRYGHFSGASLLFGPAGAEGPDLHIVYGDNEAGKTTALNAMLDLAFGIEAATPYKFRHQAAALRLGGVLEIGGASREVIRVPKSVLLGSDERALPEGLFSEDLAGLDRAAYANMFALDEKILAAGGESILASRGNLGELLFSATAGLADFASALSRLRGETEVFYKVHGRKHELGELKKRLADLKDRRAAIDVAATPFAKSIAARDAAGVAFDAAVAERGRLQGELESARRRIATLPRLAEWRRLVRDLDALPTVQHVPAGWCEEVADLRKTLLELSTRRAASEEEIARLDADIDALPVDEAGIALASHEKRIAALRARDATAVKDLPDRRAALRAAEAKVAAIGSDLGRDCGSAHQLLLSAPLVARLRQALEGLSGLTTARREAATEHDAATARHAEACSAFEAACVLAEDDPRLIGLETALDAADADDSMSRLRLAERAVAAHRDALDARMAALSPWSSDVEALAALELPEPTERERFEQELAEARKRSMHWRGETERLQDEVFRSTRIREALRSDHTLIDDAAAAASRARRDAAWTAHAATLDQQSAEEFERCLRADDAIVVTRFSQAGALGELRAIDRSLETATADLELSTRRLHGAEREHEAAETRIRAQLAPFVGASREAPIAAFDGFVVKRERALDAWRALRSAETDRSFATLDAHATRARLAAALAALGVAPPAEETLAAFAGIGRAFARSQAAGRTLAARVEDLAGEVAERERHARRCDAALAAWHEAWDRTLAGTWLAGRDAGDVRDALASLGELRSALDLRDGLADRVAKMEADCAAFAEAIRALSRSLGLDDDDDVGALADRIETRMRRAGERAVARAAKVEDRRAAKDRLDCSGPALAAALARAAEMKDRFAVATLDDLAVLFEAAQRRGELADRVRALETEICDAAKVERVEDAQSLLAALDRDDLERQRAELEARCEAQIERTQSCFAELGKARDAVDAVDGDAAAARLEAERRTILVDIEERTMAHLAMRAGIIAAEAAIGLFRDRHRSSMMKEASDLFSTLTRGAYDGLAAQTVNDTEVLVGLIAGGGSRLSTEMSTATRNQLYLALRIAAYREFVKTRRPLPFVLDDVLETFDDDRAEASLRLLADLATTGQVIYLTHHKHLRAIAQRVCPAAKMHDLGAL